MRPAHTRVARQLPWPVRSDRVDHAAGGPATSVASSAPDRVGATLGTWDDDTGETVADDEIARRLAMPETTTTTHHGQLVEGDRATTDSAAEVVEVPHHCGGSKDHDLAAGHR